MSHFGAQIASGTPGHAWACPIEVRELQLSMRLNRRSQRETPMNHKISHKFQDQTFTAKLITPPKSTYKLRLNGLCHIPGTFY